VTVRINSTTNESDSEMIGANSKVTETTSGSDRISKERVENRREILYPHRIPGERKSAVPQISDYGSTETRLKAW
jgi:hypothetical protein